MIFATIIAWLGFFIIINTFDPYDNNIVAFILFYLALFLSLLGSFSLFGFWIRKLWNRKRGIVRIMVTESFRQAIIFSSVLVIALLLQAERILTWWNMLLLIILASFLEFLILAFRQNNDEELNT